LPSFASAAQQYAGNPLNRYFVCDQEALISRVQPRSWLLGHTHESFDYLLGDTRVLCNPLGYVGHELNSRFNDALVIDI
jgi:hypothetical protein